MKTIRSERIHRSFGFVSSNSIIPAVSITVARHSLSQTKHRLIVEMHMKYIEFRDAIERELKQNPDGLTWNELRDRLAFTI